MSISKEVLLEKMGKAHVVVLDIRSGPEFEEFHIRGSHHFDLGPDPGAFAQAVEMKHGRDKFFIVYGSSSLFPAAEDAALALRKRGLWAEAYPEGMEGWHGVAYPAEGTRAREKAVIP